MAETHPRENEHPGPPAWPVFALLLPVLILAALVGVAMARDWRAAKGEATTRAQELAVDVAARMAQLFEVGPSNADPGSSLARYLLNGFEVGTSNQLLDPAPGRWPPDPLPFSRNLSPAKESIWEKASEAMNRGLWIEAVEHFETFLDGHLSADPPPSEAGATPQATDPRRRRLALFERAQALEHAGRTNGLIDEFQRVLGPFPWRGSEAPTEAGLAVGNLAILRILELAGDDARNLPESWKYWKAHAKHFEEAFDRWPPSPFLAVLAQRLKAVAISPGGQDFWDSPEQATEPLRNAETRRQRHADAMQRLGADRPWPDGFWLTDRIPSWLAFRTPPPEMHAETVADAPGRRRYALLHEPWLHDTVQSALDILDRRGELAVRLRVAERELRAGGEPARIWRREEELATTRRQVRGGLDFEVGVTLADPAAFYASQRRRLGWFGGVLGAAALAATVSAWATRRALWRQLQLNREKSNFVSSVSHELRAPLGSIRLLAEGLERGTVQAEDRRQEYFHLIGQETRRLGALVENVLDYSRIEQGRKRYEMEPTDVAAVVRDTVRLAERNASGKEVKVTLSGIGSEAEAGVDAVADARWEFTLDGRSLHQALLNLIDNAMKHAPEGSTIEVALARDGVGACLISVRDHGPGIPREDHERIFEPFFRRGSELRRETEGVGIGLSIVRHIALAHGGRVEVESEPGRGACFTLVLPADRRHTGGSR